LSSAAAASDFLLLRDFFVPLSDAAVVSDSAAFESAFFLDFLADFDPVSPAAAESSAAALSFLAFFFDFLVVVVVESSVEVCAFANDGDTAIRTSKQHAIVHSLTFHCFLFMMRSFLGVLGLFVSGQTREWQRLPYGQSLGSFSEGDIMPVLRLKVNFGGDETPRKNVLLEERMK